MEANAATMDNATTRTTPPTKTTPTTTTTPPPPRSSSSTTPSHTSDSRTSSNSELEREIAYLNLSDGNPNTNGSRTANGSNGSVSGSNGSCAGDNLSNVSASTTGLSTATTTTTSSGAADRSASNNGTIKKRISSSRTTPALKARRIRFYRNGDRFYAGIVLAVSAERYRSFESLVEDLTRLMEDRISGAVRNIYTTAGKRIASLDDIEDGLECVCLCNKETFKKLEYAPQPNKQANRLSRHLRAGSPHINGSGSSSLLASSSSPYTNGGGSATTTSATPSVAQCVHPRIVTLIRNGTKPRKVLRLLLNKRNSPSFDHVLTAITQCVKLDSGCVRKVFTLGGTAVQQLADFFGAEAVFFAYGTERVQPDDFRLEGDEQRAVAQTRRTLGRNGAGATAAGPKPKMPVKNSVNLHNTTYDAAEADALLSEDADVDSESCGTAATAADADDVEQQGHGMGLESVDLPERIEAEYAIGPIVGDGNFAVVLRVLERSTGRPFALKIIDKSKCKGKEHYIDAEVRVMKKLRHPHIMALMFDVDTPTNMFLVLEYVSGGDLFDAITSATRFTEPHARIMVRHLASAMAYLHSLGIVHRDIKPENLLVELDADGQVTELKLADFGLACEVVQPLLAVCGTPTYVAPEILLETGYGLKIDVWAAGIILYILLCGFPPFVSPDNQQEPLFDAILSGVYEFPEPYWNDIGDDVRDLIANMLQSDPDLRFSSEDVLDHVWTIGGGGGGGGSSNGGSESALVDFS